ncbi:hypothetical protein [Nostoc sp.]|uniref:hypothetical protein n=1 Tax=Nostoc sp. TaxID=1180 RepID=UPI002FF56A96
MNSPPKPSNTNYPKRHPTEFEQIIQEKSHNFVGREFVFAAINNFIENNFMYLSQVISAIPSVSYAKAENFYPESFESNQSPPGFEAYYQQHLHKMFPPEQGTEHSTDVLNILIQQQKAISVEALAQPAAGIAQIIDTDEYEVEEVLENWLQFLQQKRIASETYYSLYHSNF